jgi:hypothetical protein
MSSLDKPFTNPVTPSASVGSQAKQDVPAKSGLPDAPRVPRQSAGVVTRQDLGAVTEDGAAKSSERDELRHGDTQKSS